MNDNKENKRSEDADKKPESIQILAPDPITDDDIQRKIKTNRVPRPLPQRADTTQAKAEEPISSETISIKKSALKDELKKEEKVRTQDEIRKLKIVCYHCGQKLDLTDMEPFSEVECPACNVKIIVPKWFENYLLEEPGGEGGMAIVYRALDLTLDREVAIKILSPSFAAEVDRAQLFLHEARTAATINHYAVIPVYTCGSSDGKPYIVMQYMEGGSLETKLENANGKLPVNQVIKWFRDIADGLDNARRHGIIHHDVKPANILLDRDGNAKIGDFGIAQILHDWRSENIAKITKTWASPNYVSPEKITTGQEDYYGDIYSLGVSMFQMLTGKLPFDDPDIKTLIRMRLEKDPPNPKEFRTEIPLKISQLVISMMDRGPDKRPSYREIINTIEEHLKLTESLKKTPEKKLEEKKKKPAILKRKITGDNAIAKITPLFTPQKMSTSKIIIHFLILILIGSGLVFLWKSGYLETIFGKSQTNKMPRDLLPEATAQFRVGNSAKALEIARSAIDSLDSDKDKMKQAAIQTAFALYLQNMPDAKIETLLLAEKLSGYGVNEDDPVMNILRYLANGEIYANKLKDEFIQNDYYKLITSYCFYVKSLYEGEKSLELVSLLRRCFVLGKKMEADFWGNVWLDRLETWKDWTELGKGDQAKLEPLIVANKYDLKISQNAERTTAQKKAPKEPIELPKNEKITVDNKSLEENLATVDISLLTAQWLEADRASFASARPRPTDYNFTQTMVDGYIAGVNQARKENESIRIKHVSEIKNYICQLLTRSTYPRPIRTRDGKTHSGKMMLNPNYISIDTGRGFQRMKWNDMPPSEIANILAHFADMRLKVSGNSGDSTSDSRKKEAAQDYLLAALISEWYGDYEKAVGYSKKSLLVYPGAEKTVKKIIMK